MTPRQRAEWQRAIREGRMVSFGHVLRPYPSPKAARRAVAAASGDDVTPMIVPSTLAAPVKHGADQ
jgi:hypothetical protein